MTPGEQLLAVVKRHRNAQERLAGRLVDSTGAIVDRATAEIAHVLLAEFNGTVTAANRTAALNRARQIIKSSGLSGAQAAREMLPEIAREGLVTARQASKLVIARGSQLERMVRTYDAFEQSIEQGKAFVLGSEKIAAFMDRYAVDWDNGWSSTIRGLQAKFTAASASGLDWRVVAKSIVPEAGQLVVPGGMSPRRLAEFIAKSKVVEIDNLTQREMAQDEGLEKFVNLGVPDDGQEEECYDACNAGALTEEEWEAGLGMAPRHVGCRCLMFAVPFDPGLSVDNNRFDIERRPETEAA
jgi:hypothetical protein